MPENDLVDYQKLSGCTDGDLKNSLVKLQEQNTNIIGKGTLNDLKTVLDSISDINSDDIVYYNNCKLCKSEYRFEAEQEWDRKQKNSLSIFRWLTEEKHLCITPSEVNHHMREHYSRQESELRLKDYSSKIGNFLRVKHQKISIVETAIAICSETMARVAVLETRGDIQREKIRADCLSKITGQLATLIELQARMQGDVNPAEAVTQKFVTVWTEQMRQASPEVRQQMVRMLELIQNKGEKS